LNYIHFQQAMESNRVLFFILLFNCFDNYIYSTRPGLHDNYDS